MATSDKSSSTRRQASPGHRSRFGDVMRRLRRAAQLTQAELAHRVGLQGHAFLSQVENGRLPLPSHWLIPLAEEFGVSPQRLAWVYVAMELPDLYEAIGGRKPPDMDPETLLRMLALGRPSRSSNSTEALSPIVAAMPKEMEEAEQPAEQPKPQRIVRN